jgi:hypothetical protein
LIQFHLRRHRAALGITMDDASHALSTIPKDVRQQKRVHFVTSALQMKNSDGKDTKRKGLMPFSGVKWIPRTSRTAKAAASKAVTHASLQLHPAHQHQHGVILAAQLAVGRVAIHDSHLKLPRPQGSVAIHDSHLKLLMLHPQGHQVQVIIKMW